MSAGHSAGACTSRRYPRIGMSRVQISHRHTPKLKQSACGLQGRKEVNIWAVETHCKLA